MNKLDKRCDKCLFWRKGFKGIQEKFKGHKYYNGTMGVCGKTSIVTLRTDGCFNYEKSTGNG